MKKAKVSLREIATAAGVSIGAVSQILNNDPRNYSRAEVKEKVRAIAMELGYRQSFGDQLVRGEATPTVVLLMPGQLAWGEEHLAQLGLRLVSEFEGMGYSCYMAELSGDGEANLKRTRDLIARGGKNFIFIGECVGFEQIERIFIEEAITYIGYAGSMAQNSFRRSVIVDTGAAIAEQIKFFLDNGKSDFVQFLLRTRVEQKTEGKLDGLFRCFPAEEQAGLLKRHVVCFDEELDKGQNFADYCYHLGARLTSEELQRNPGRNGFLYMNDLMAAGGASVLLAVGRKIGQDTYVAGFNDNIISRFYPYPLSSANHNFEEMISVMKTEIFQDKPVAKIIPAKAILRKGETIL